MCLALALWNGQDPILKERLFGLTNSRGQPRRGREGVLLLRRQRAHPLVDAVAVQVPARRPSRTTTCWRPTGPAASVTRSTSCWTPASSTTDATSTSRSTTPRPARRTCWPASPSATAAPTRRRSTCSRRCGSATPGRGAPGPRSRRCAPWTARRPCVAAHHDAGRRLLAARSRRRRPAVLRERDEHRTAVGRAQRLAVRQGRRRPGGRARRAPTR